MFQRIILLFFCFAVFFSYPAWAGENFKAVGVISIRSKRVNLEISQGMKIENGRALFVGISDFGSNAFIVELTPETVTLSLPTGVSDGGKKPIKKILSLPLKQQEFVDAITYIGRDLCPNVSVEDPCEGNGFVRLARSDEQELWQHARYRALRVLYEDFRLDSQGRRQPYKIEISYKKNKILTTWQSVVRELTN